MWSAEKSLCDTRDRLRGSGYVPRDTLPGALLASSPGGTHLRTSSSASRIPRYHLRESAPAHLRGHLRLFRLAHVSPSNAEARIGSTTASRIANSGFASTLDFSAAPSPVNRRPDVMVRGDSISMVGRAVASRYRYRRYAKSAGQAASPTNRSLDIWPSPHQPASRFRADIEAPLRSGDFPGGRSSETAAYVAPSEERGQEARARTWIGRSPPR